MSRLPDSSLPWPIVMPAVALIAERESCRLRAYRCPAGKWTCGWGETDGVGPDTVWTQEEADQRFLRSLHKFSGAVNAACTTAPSPMQLGAMTSLAYNIGLKGFEGSTVLRAHNRGDFQAAARAFGLWNKATVDGVLQVLNGLTSRRAAEAALYLAPELDAPPERMPQAVQAESSVASSQIAQSGAATAGTGLLVLLGQVKDWLGPVGEWFKSVRSLFGDSVGLSPDWVLPVALVVFGLAAVYWRLKQRKNGWA